MSATAEVAPAELAPGPSHVRSAVESIGALGLASCLALSGAVLSSLWRTYLQSER
jgi:hypothetical protein